MFEQLKTKTGFALGAVGLLLAAFMGGRYSAPTKTVTIHEKGETKIEYRDRVVVKYVEKKTHSTTTTTTKPDGTKTSTTTTDTDTASNTKSDDKSSSTKTSYEKDTKVVEGFRPSWRLGGLIGMATCKLGLNIPPPLYYGAIVERRLIGPVWMGAWGNTDIHNLAASTRFGLSLAMEF